MPDPVQSPSGSLNATDLKKMAVAAGKLAAGAAVEAICHYVSGQSWGPYQGIVALVVAGVLDIGHKYFAGAPKP